MNWRPPPVGLTPVTMTVPVSVPSLFQSCSPELFVAEKKSSLLKIVRSEGLLFPSPKNELMSFTSTVPTAVPSLFQSSVPSVGSVAVKRACR